MDRLRGEVDSSDERLDEPLSDDVYPGSVLQLRDRAAVAPEGSVGEGDVFACVPGELGGPGWG
jgi:hypothetical protein